MKLRQSMFGLVALSLFTGGCASSAGAPNEVIAQPSEIAPVAMPTSSAFSILPSSGLGPQELLEGECALFLWSKTDASKFIFFSKALSGQALFKFGDKTYKLKQTGAGGSIFGQFNTRQAFAEPSISSFELSFQPGENLQNGQRLEDGLITLTDKEGWRTKLPVLGVRACQVQ